MCTVSAVIAWLCYMVVCGLAMVGVAGLSFHVVNFALGNIVWCGLTVYFAWRYFGALEREVVIVEG